MNIYMYEILTNIETYLFIFAFINKQFVFVRNILFNQQFLIILNYQKFLNF